MSLTWLYLYLFFSMFLWLLLSVQCVLSTHTLSRGLVIKLLVVPCIYASYRGIVITTHQ